MVRPWRTRVQKARTRADRSAKATSPAMASTVSTNSVKRGCEAKNARSKAGSLEKSGGLGNAPCVNAKARMGIAMHRSKISSTTKLEATAGELDPGTEERGGDRRGTPPPRGGNTPL